MMEQMSFLPTKSRKLLTFLLILSLLFTSITLFSTISQAAAANVAAGRIITASDTLTGNAGIVTDGNKNTANFVGITQDLQWIQMDLGSSVNINKINLWHYLDGRTYHDVIVRISNTVDFSSGVTTVFNNDTNNSAGLGTGSDAEYAETTTGKTINFTAANARYVRLYTNGSNANVYNHYVEVEVWSTDTTSTSASITTGGTVAASSTSSPAGEEKEKAFDGTVNTKWLTVASMGWIQYQLTTAKTVIQYSIASANDFPARDPKNWTLKGSNDGTNWTTLDTKTNQTFANRFQTNTYSFSNSTAYLYYRLDVSANNGDTLLQIAEIGLFTSTSTSTPTPTPTPTATPIPGGMPAKVVGGYWPYWPNSAIRIRDINSNYNLIYLFHAKPVGGSPGTTGAVYWTSPGNGRGAATNLVADIQYARSVQGRKIILSVGGADNGMSFPNRTKSQTFVDSIVSIYNQLGGFDGLDWNTYEGSQTPDTNEMIWISKELKRLYPGFIISSPPAPWNAVDKAFCQAMVQAGAMDYAAPQYYDGPNLDDPAYVVNNINEWVSLLGATHVVVGFGVDSAANYMTINEAVTTWNQVKTNHPTIRGAFDWQIHNDESQGWPFANTLKPLINP